MIIWWNLALFPLEAVAKASEEALAATARDNEAEERAKLTEEPRNLRINMIWYDMIWYDRIGYDMIWYDMMYVCMYIYIYIYQERKHGGFVGWKMWMIAASFTVDLRGKRSRKISVSTKIRSRAICFPDFSFESLVIWLDRNLKQEIGPSLMFSETITHKKCFEGLYHPFMGRVGDGLLLLL